MSPKFPARPFCRLAIAGATCAATASFSSAADAGTLHSGVVSARTAPMRITALAHGSERIESWTPERRGNAISTLADTLRRAERQRAAAQRAATRLAARRAAAQAARVREAAESARDLDEVHEMVEAGNQIAILPYVWGGGHGSFTASGYDCSGSVSYVLHAAGLLSTPLTSGDFESYGEPGPGRYVTIYANDGHVLMTIDGRRFDTIALQETGTRWSDELGDTSGYVVRHPAGM